MLGIFEPFRPLFGVAFFHHFRHHKNYERGVGTGPQKYSHIEKILENLWILLYILVIVENLGAEGALFRKCLIFIIRKVNFSKILAHFSQFYAKSGGGGTGPFVLPTLTFGGHVPPGAPKCACLVGGRVFAAPYEKGAYGAVSS